MMIRLNGGMGNQMFQYAFGISLGARWNEKPYFHKVGLDNGQHRAYSLDSFNTEVEFKNPESGPVYGEPVFRFDPKVYDQPKNTYFAGCWQTEKYFNETLVRGHFTLRNPLSPESFRQLEQINKFISCAIHVRRTDYLIPSVQQYHGLMGMDYYKAAMEYVESRVPYVQFFVFSDDTKWCKQTFDKSVAIVDVNGFGNGTTGPQREHEDLYLMSQCNHAIIPNSSFGWFGAWLNPWKRRIVVAPKVWFQKPGLAYDDIVPDRWVKI
jgi:hypothetical protein